MNRICEAPGTSIPTSTNGQSSPACTLDQDGEREHGRDHERVAGDDAAPTSGSAPRRRREPDRTASSAEEAPASTPKRTASTY